ncbi:putative glucosylglycerolphosphate phosphatase [Prochlorococcus marinus str. MIT 9515]|uniref:Putative glucosylglycerolphosphate phosphatase n=1 Tax=Prochlorococcus marinus (strain MIT 9515) TaxID=167542 RepID=A2BVV3_PROM5|nr:glucosylglycerol 3-phosphatase [Prochlorococcus marinus]ABM71914.1 putative glucosylglycerolphosphate phosphatase [Prochlorococcus marinus str. MIT 9515]
MNHNKLDFENIIINSKNILFIQDIDGVCIPLVKDPMTRKLESKYIFAAKDLEDEFFVLTCGEHDGPRGVNRIVERSLNSNITPKEKGLYLRGLAACGVEYQDNNGHISFEGVSKKEVNFLNKVPELMRPDFETIVKKIFPNLDQEEINSHALKSICETRFSPTINFNSLFDLVEEDSEKRKLIQRSFEDMMKNIIYKAECQGLKNSFFLHISPNLGSKNGNEIIKLSTKNDIGSTDIQLLLKGAVKDSGVLFLLNKFIYDKTGKAPFGRNFNFRDSPNSLKEKVDFCKNNINSKDMPTIIGIGDTVTSKKNINNLYLRGGSDRSFLEFIQLLGKEFKSNNKIIFVDSSSGEVNRPSTKISGLNGISDEEDHLKFDMIFQNGPREYINWFIEFVKNRSKIKKNLI